jgi:hypothetical protein
MARHAWRVILGGIAVVFVLLLLDGPAARKPPAPAAEKPRKIIGQTTQRVLDLAPALAAGGVLVDNAAEAEEGGLAAYSQAYRHSVAALAGIAVDQKMAVYRAEHDDLPATHAEFMDAIIAPGSPDEIRLPLLPHYQEYAFDPARRKLVVVEFPARKAAP